MVKSAPTVFYKDMLKLQISFCHFHKTSFTKCATSLRESVINFALVDCSIPELERFFFKRLIPWDMTNRILAFAVSEAVVLRVLQTQG